MQPSTTEFDHFMAATLQPMLENDEQIYVTGFLFRRSPLLAALSPLAMLGRGYFFAALTNKRLLLIETRMGLFRLEKQNLGVTSVPYRSIRNLTCSRFINFQKLRLSLDSGDSIVLRLNRIATAVASGQARFVDALKHAVHSPRPAERAETRDLYSPA